MPAVRSKLRQLWLGVRGWVLHLLPKPVSVPLQADRIHRILLIRLDRLGDVVLTSALLKPLHQLFPHAQVDIWVKPAFAPLFKAHPYLRQVHTVRPDADYDLVIDPVLDDPLEGARRAASFAAPWTMGFDVAGRGRWFNLCLPPPAKDEPFLHSLLRLLRMLGYAGEIEPPRLAVSDKERRQARGLLGHGKPLALLHPGAHYPSQRWPAAHFAQLSDMLTNGGCHVAVIGAAGDRPVVDAIRSQVRGKKHFAVIRDQPLRIMMALMAEAAVVVANNSGPLHLAGALGVPTVSTLGPTNPVIWWPVGEKQTVLQDSGCCHCGRGVCPRHCLERIRPETMLTAVRTLLQGAC